MECLLIGRWPTADHNNDHFESGFRARQAGSRLKLRACCVSVCGDWAWCKQVLALHGWKSDRQGRMCWICRATTGNAFDFSLQATWRTTLVRPQDTWQDVFESHGHVSGIWSLPGFTLSFVRVDWMHTCCLGVLQHAAGSCLWGCFRLLGGTYTTWRSACIKLYSMASMAARSLGTDMPFAELTIGMMRAQVGVRAKLRLKAAEGRYFLPILIRMLAICYDLGTPHLKLQHNCLNQLQLCYVELETWGAGAPERVALAARRFCILYKQLSDESHDGSVWTLVPKFHLFLHCAEGCRLNPRLEWNYGDEDEIGQASDFARFSNVAHFSTSVMKRYCAMFRWDEAAGE